MHKKVNHIHKEFKLPFKAHSRRPGALVKHFTLHHPTSLNFEGSITLQKYAATNMQIMSGNQ